MSREPTITGVAVAEIVTTAGTQIRCEISESTVAEYAEALSAGDCFPPVTIFHDGSQYILADGFHRVIAATRAGRETIFADVRTGSRSDALRFALSANATHGVRRTNADKRHSVELALAEWPKLSTAEIARICAVSRPQVDAVRCEHAESACSTETRIGADGRERKVAKKKAPAVEKSPAPPSVQVEGQEAEPAPAEPSQARPEFIITADGVAIDLAALGQWSKRPGVEAVMKRWGVADEVYTDLVAVFAGIVEELE